MRDKSLIDYLTEEDQLTDIKVSDGIANLYRIAESIAEIDKKVGKKIAMGAQDIEKKKIPIKEIGINYRWGSKHLLKEITDQIDRYFRVQNYTIIKKECEPPHSKLLPAGKSAYGRSGASDDGIKSNS